MEEKRADNFFEKKDLETHSPFESRKYLETINEQIDNEKGKMKNLDDMEEMFVSLNKNISKCVELLNKSIKGKTVANKLNSIEENNKISFMKSMNSIDSERDRVKDNIIRLNQEKEEYEDKLKEGNKNKEKDNTIE